MTAVTQQTSATALNQPIRWATRTTFASIVGVMSAMASAQQAPTPRTDLSVSLGGRYDSNVARSSAASAQARGLTRDDFVLTPAVNVDVLRVFGTNSFSVHGSAGYDFHARNSRLDRERIGLDTGLDVGVGPCRVTPHAYIRRAQSDLADLVTIARPAESVRNVETSVGAGSELTCGREYGFQPTVGIDYRRGTNSNVLRARSEYEEWSYEGGLRYASRNLGTITAFISRRDTDLPGQPTIGGGTGGYRDTEYGLRYKRDLGTRLIFSGSIARSELTGRDSRIGQANGFTWDAALTVLVSDRLQVTGNFGRQISNSLASDSAFTVSKPYSVRVDYAASQRLRFDAGLSVTDRDYRYATAPASAFIDQEKRTVVDGGVTLRSGQRLQLRFGGGYERRDANGTFFDYNAAFATASVSLRF